MPISIFATELPNKITVDKVKAKEGAGVERGASPTEAGGWLPCGYWAKGTDGSKRETSEEQIARLCTVSKLLST